MMPNPSIPKERINIGTVASATKVGSASPARFQIELRNNTLFACAYSCLLSEPNI